MQTWTKIWIGVTTFLLLLGSVLIAFKETALGVDALIIAAVIAWNWTPLGSLIILDIKKNKRAR